MQNRGVFFRSWAWYMMTDNFKFIYKILKTLESAMDCSEFDLSQISAEKLGISSERWGRYLEMMYDVGLINGVRVYNEQKRRQISIEIYRLFVLGWVKRLEPSTFRATT